jgi:DNA-directed RNA polymerase specialized sigma24 family protein
MSDAISRWRDWLSSECALTHIQVVIRRTLSRVHDTDLDDLTAEVIARLLPLGNRYDPARGLPSTFGDTLIPRVLIDALRWLGRHCRDKQRAVRLASLAPRSDDDVNDGFEFDPPEADVVADDSRQRDDNQRHRDDAIQTALSHLDERTRRFAERIMQGMAPRRSGAHAGWSWRETEAAITRVEAALLRAGVTAGDRP